MSNDDESESKLNKSEIHTTIFSSISETTVGVDDRGVCLWDSFDFLLM